MTKIAKTAPKVSAKAPKAAKVKGSKKVAPKVIAAPAIVPSAKAQTPAGYVRESLLAGMDGKAIRAELATRFPTYGAAGIAVGVYRRELQKKGLMAS